LIGVLVFGAINRTLAKSDVQNSGQGGYGRSGTETGQGGYGRSGTETSQGGYGRSSAETGQGGYDRSGTDTSHLEAGQGFQGGQGKGGNGGGGGSRGKNRQSEMGSLPAASGDLGPAEADALTYMREEEKLAHDVYVTLYEKWGLATFQNIANSEQTHTESVKALLDRYGLQDPASSQVGVFNNPDLQALFNTLVAQGSQSLAEALKVGAAIEEIDILDVEERLAQTDNADIQQVFNNLLSGSRNHLRAFTSTLQSQTGEIYQPQYLSLEAYQAIIGAGTETGGKGNRGGGNGYRGGRP
jgi:hypothetical protein